jgi:arylsulfatase A-like enzyme
MGAYDEELLFVDAQLGRLLDGLEARGRLGDSLVMLVADHGEEFFDHGGFEHGHSVFQELLRVPLVAWGPGVRPARIEAPVSIADVFPTVLEALGIPVEPGVAGRSLWGLLRGGAVPPERSLVAEALLHKRERKALIRWPHKLVFEPSSGRSQLFDLAADPAETRDLAESEPGLRQELLAELEATLEAASRERAARREATFPEAIEERLRGLGYLDAEGS